MKAMLPLVGAIVIGLLAGSYVSGNRVKDQLLEEAAEHTVEATHEPEPTAEGGGPEMGAGGTANPAEPAAGQTGGVAQGEPVPPVDGSDGVVQQVDATLTPEPTAPEPAVEPEPEVAAPAPAVDSTAIRAQLAEEGAQKIAQVFGAMQAEDAAEVMAEMEDAEIELILRYMNNRLAAQILGLFDPSRAAVLSRAVLGGGGA